jgi:glycosyltransferase involved in cell wall biosynthesis
VKDVLSEADVLVDQLLLGICGMAGLETMALGKPVITYLREDLQGMYPDGFPAVHATKETLVDVLEELLSDLPRRIELGIAGRTYVERHHSPEALGAKLLDLYASA